MIRPRLHIAAQLAHPPDTEAPALVTKLSCFEFTARMDAPPPPSAAVVLRIADVGAFKARVEAKVGVRVEANFDVPITAEQLRDALNRAS